MVRGSVAVPDWRVTLNGQDLSDAMRPYLMALTVSERRGEMADQLSITLDDSKGELQLPPAGAILSVALGWLGGGGTSPGLVEKGDFTVDEVAHGGPPDTITIRARSADFTHAWRRVRDQSYRDGTLGDVLREVAARQGVNIRIADVLANMARPIFVQSRESDLAFLARLGAEYDAVATVKGGTLIFLPMGGGQTASGASLPTVNINRGDGDRHNFRIAARQDYSGVSAKWHDRIQALMNEVEAQAARISKVPISEERRTAQRDAETQQTSAGNDDNPKILRKVYPTEQEAQRAAEAEWARIQRAPLSLSLSLALGRPEIGAEQPVTVNGFRNEIGDQDWLVSDVTHRLDQGGLTSELSCELAG